MYGFFLLQVSKSTVWRRLKRLKQDTPSMCEDQDTASGCMTSCSSTVGALGGCDGPGEEQRVKIEVVESLPPDSLDTHHFQYSEPEVTQPEKSQQATPSLCERAEVNQEVVDSMKVANTVVDMKEEPADTLEKMDIVIGPSKVEVADNVDRMEVVAGEVERIEVVAREVDRMAQLENKSKKMDGKMEVVATEAPLVVTGATPSTSHHLTLLQQEDEGSLTVGQDGKVVTEGEGQRFELEMPLVRIGGPNLFGLLELVMVKFELTVVQPWISVWEKQYLACKLCFLGLTQVPP